MSARRTRTRGLPPPPAGPNAIMLPAARPVWLDTARTNIALAYVFGEIGEREHDALDRVLADAIEKASSP